MKDCPPDAIHRAPNGEVLHRRQLHRLRQLRAQLPVRRDPDGAARSRRGTRPACGRGCCRVRRRAGREPQGPRQAHAEEGGEVRHVQGTSPAAPRACAPARPAPRSACVRRNSSTTPACPRRLPPEGGVDLLREPLNKSRAVALQRQMRMHARRATKVVVHTTIPRSAAKQAPHLAAARRDGAFRAVCFVASLAKGAGH